MRRVASSWVGLVAAAFFASDDPARAQEPAEIVEESSEDAAETPSVADAHAQFADVLPSLSEREAADRRFGSWLAYGGVDGWRYGGSAYAGAEWSPSPQSAFIVRLFASDGLDDFRTRFENYRSETARASVLPGLRIQSGKLDIKLFVGADYQMRIPLRPALEKPMQFFGARATIDAWWEPTENLMLSGSASATTIESGFSARLASGWRLPFAWIGPEVLATHDIFNTQYRAGAHLSGVKVGITEWSVAGGYARDSFGRSSPYGRIGITLRP